jgi:hypothetical protein
MTETKRNLVTPEICCENPYSDILGLQYDYKFCSYYTV